MSTDSSPRLSQPLLRALPVGVIRPAYPRHAGAAGVVHFGVGAFHRSHQAVYLDELMSLDTQPAWPICGVGLLESDGPLLGALTEQDHLYSVFSYDGAGAAVVRVVGSLQECLWSPVDREAILDRLAHTSTKIVSLTITEGGYNVNEVTGQFDLTNPGILDELADPRRPLSAFGYIVEGLRRRREAGVVPYSVLSCDNIEGNGRLLRGCVLAYAEHVDADLAAWIAKHVSFPSSMVDRITPVATAADAARVSDLLGCTDSVPVVAETYRRWVVEDDFPAGRPDLERVGVQFVADVRPFELMKLRLLNGAHQALGYVAALLGFDTVHEAARDPLIDAFLGAYLLTEAAPTLPDVPGTPRGDYVETVRRRLQSDFPADTVARLTEFGSDRLPKFVVPVIRARLEAGLPVGLGAHVLAAWALFLNGKSESGTPFSVRDHRAAELQALALDDEDPGALLQCRDLFGDLCDHEGLMAPFVAAQTSFRTSGVRQTLADLLSRQSQL